MSAAILDIATKRRLAVGQRLASRAVESRPTPFLRKCAKLATVRPRGAEVIERLVDDLLDERDNWDYDERGRPLE